MLQRLGILSFVASCLVSAASMADDSQFGEWGIDLQDRDLKVAPGDDFFRYANGGWLDKTPIPADKPGVSLRLKMTDVVDARVHALLEAAAAKASHQPTSLSGKAGAFYRAFMDEARIEEIGTKPLAGLLDEVRAAQTREQIAAIAGRSNYTFAGGLFNISIDIDFDDPSRYLVYINQGGLGLPDRDYYLQANFAPVRAEYLKYVATLLTLLQWPEPQKRAQAVVDFETALAKDSWTKTQQRDLTATYNLMEVSKLERFTYGFSWRDYLASARLAGVEQVVVAEKSAFPNITRTFRRTPVEALRAWEAFHIADNAAPYLSKDFVTAHFEMRDRALAGQQEIKARWKRAVLAVSGGDFGVGSGFGVFGTFGFGVGQLYAEKYFPPAAKTNIEALAANLKAAYRVRIEKLDWMSAATKTAALKKLDTYRIKVGYPDHPRDYSAVVIRDDDLIGDVYACATADWLRYMSRLNSPVDRDDWLMTPQTNDAYNGSLRDIVFPAGILQPPVFDPNADPAVNYGAIGGVIGHELTHGFDDQGRKIDAVGAIHDWWGAADAKQFEARAKRLGRQYSAFEPLPNVHVNGDLTMGENIADLGGVTLALDAYHASLHGTPAPVIDGVTGDQRVLLGWAQAWRGKVTDDYVRQQVVSDPHAPRQFRVNGVVRNLDAWYAAFGVKPGDKLYVAPADRVRIW